MIVLYDTSSGEQIANLSGHSAWVLSLSWSHTGEYLLSRYARKSESRRADTNYLLKLLRRQSEGLVDRYQVVCGHTL